jgi:uncharacterized RDD family membrane protein YckC
VTASTTTLPTASWPRRFLALFVDWIASTLVTTIFVSPRGYFVDHRGDLLPLLIYVLEAGILTWLLGGSFGKLCTGLRVLPADGVPRPINPIVLLVRQLLVILVIPPLVFRPDGRGLHDIMAGTVTVTRPTYDAVLDRYRRPSR